MSFKVTRLIVSKRITTGNEHDGWTRQGYELEVSIQDEKALQEARVAAESLINEWLSDARQGRPLPQKTAPKDLTQLPFNIDAIPWVDKTSDKGPFQLCDVETNPDFAALRKFVFDHAGGSISTRDKQGLLWYVWVFQDSKTLGQKKSQFVTRRR